MSITTGFTHKADTNAGLSPQASRLLVLAGLAIFWLAVGLVVFELA